MGELGAGVESSGSHIHKKDSVNINNVIAKGIQASYSLLRGQIGLGCLEEWSCDRALELEATGSTNLKREYHAQGRRSSVTAALGEFYIYIYIYTHVRDKDIYSRVFNYPSLIFCTVLLYNLVVY